MKNLYYILVFFVFCGCTVKVKVEGLEKLVPEGGLINIPEHVVDIDNQTINGVYQSSDDDSGVDNE